MVLAHLFKLKAGSGKQASLVVYPVSMIGVIAPKTHEADMIMGGQNHLDGFSGDSFGAGEDWFSGAMAGEWQQVASASEHADIKTDSLGLYSPSAEMPHAYSTKALEESDYQYLDSHSAIVNDTTPLMNLVETLADNGQIPPQEGLFESVVPDAVLEAESLAPAIIEHPVQETERSTETALDSVLEAVQPALEDTISPLDDVPDDVAFATDHQEASDTEALIPAKALDFYQPGPLDESSFSLPFNPAEPQQSFDPVAFDPMAPLFLETPQIPVSLIEEALFCLLTSKPDPNLMDVFQEDATPSTTHVLPDSAPEEDIIYSLTLQEEKTISAFASNDGPESLSALQRQIESLASQTGLLEDAGVSDEFLQRGRDIATISLD